MGYRQLQPSLPGGVLRPSSHRHRPTPAPPLQLCDGHEPETQTSPWAFPSSSYAPIGSTPTGTAHFLSCPASCPAWPGLSLLLRPPGLLTLVSPGPVIHIAVPWDLPKIKHGAKAPSCLYGKTQVPSRTTETPEDPAPAQRFSLTLTPFGSDASARPLPCPWDALLLPILKDSGHTGTLQTPPPISRAGHPSLGSPASSYAELYSYKVQLLFTHS